MPALLVALLLGIVAGLRAVTAPAVLWLMRHRSPVAYLLGVLALLEYAGDLSPKAPARTDLTALLARVVSGGFCGGAIALTSHVSLLLGVLAGALGAVIGAYGGLFIRLRAAELIGRVPAALLEDAVAIVGAVLVVEFA
ncbi:MAG: hypothetical protein JO311_01100 [Candidatus Eremiobacteraeota bacterium]|nr:hypothetical protein [Candidatus Eremiobacteraeota bacterium]MBV9263833.1 hypothetical protein [Candidatus Eremiobacteraeota bacterium]